MAHDVFVSYSSKDKNVADALCSAMETAGIRCWVAPRDVAPGADWAESIVAALQRSRVMVLVFSGHSNQSQQVRKELTVASGAGVIIVPVKLDDTPLEGTMQYYLSDTHWLDAMNPPTEEQILALVDTVRSLVKSRGGGARLVAWGQRTLKQPKRLLLVAAAAVLLAALAVGVASYALYGIRSVSPAKSSGPSFAEGPELRAVATLRFTSEPKGMAFANDTAYFACGEGGVEWGDTRTGDFEWLGTYPLQGAIDVAAEGDVAYVLVGPTTTPDTTGTAVLVLSFADRARPTLLATYRPRSFSGPGESVNGIVASGRWLALTTWGKAELVDVSDPSRPGHVWTWDTGENSMVPCTAQFIDRSTFPSRKTDVLALGVGVGGIRFFDLADPTSPRQVGAYKGGDWIVDLAVTKDQRLVASVGTAGIAVLEVGDPPKPRSVAVYQIPGYVAHLAAWNDTAFFSTAEMKQTTVSGTAGAVPTSVPTNPGIGRVRIGAFKGETVQTVRGAVVRSPAAGIVDGVSVAGDSVFSLEQGVGVNVYQAVEAPALP